LFTLFAPLESKFTASPRKKGGKTKPGYKDLLLLIQNRVSQKIAERVENDRLEKVCFVAQEGTDSKKSDKWG